MTQTTRLLILPATDRNHPDKITVTISGPKCPDRARVLDALTGLFGRPSRWDGPLPNVDLVGEHTGK